MNHLISPEYKEQIKILHSGTDWGADGFMWANQVAEMIRSVNATSVLDYGCGKGTLKKALSPLFPAVIFHEYDPGIPGKDSLPEYPVDLVVCTDVLEHIEYSKLEAVLTHIERLTEKAAYFRIDLKQAKTLLPDGRNAHLIIEAPEWWSFKIGTRLPITHMQKKSSNLEIRVQYGGKVLDIGKHL